MSSPGDSTHHQQPNYAAILDALPAHVALLDNEGRIVAVNKAWKEFARTNDYQGPDFGIGANYVQICERTSSEGAHEVNVVADGLRRVLGGEIERFEHEYSCHSADEKRWFRMTVAPLRPGSAEGAVVMHMDVTGRKLMEGELSRERHQLRALIDNLPESIYIKDIQGRYLINNHGNTLRLGRSTEDEVIGCTVFDFFPREVAQSYDTVDRRVCETGVPLLNHEEPFEINGRKGWFSTTKIPLRDEMGKVTGLIGVSRDITEDKVAELERLRLITAVEQSVESIVTLSPEGMIQFVNLAFERTTGFSREDVADRSYSLMTLAGLDEFDFDSIKIHIDNRGLWTGRYRTRRKDGSDFVEEATVSAVRNFGGEVVNYLVISRDITKEIALEEQVRQAQKMEAVGLLAGGVAHDFNNILQVIQGYTALALHDLPTDSEQHVHLKHVAGAAERASQLTRQLLAFGRRQTLQKVDTDLNLLINDLLKMIRRLIGEHILVEFHPGVRLHNVKCDRSQIEQVLVNLCINARDAMSDGGRIVITLENAQFDTPRGEGHLLARAGRYVCLTVTDTGIGMDKATLARIFEPFFTTKSKDKGTGLGLSVVYGVVKQHEGSLDVISEPGVGTTFRLLLPSSEPIRKSDQTTILMIPKPGNETILLAEDEEAVRSLATLVLKRAGYRVLVANNGREACELFIKNPEGIDLLLFDVVMPEMGGKEAYDRIRAVKPNVPVLFSSGYSGSAFQGGQNLEEGILMLPKPYRADDLLVRVREIIDRAKRRAARSSKASA